MKKLFMIMVALFLVASAVWAEWVNGYMRRDGTYVSGYNRSDADNTVTNNYSYKGNYNPYTGETGSNYYRNSPTSQYYGTTGSSGYWYERNK